MAIHVTCSACGKVLQARDEDAGRQAQCASCGNMLTIPDISEPPPPPPPSQSPGYRCERCGRTFGAREVYNDHGRYICKECYGPPEYEEGPPDWQSARRRPRPRYREGPYEPYQDIQSHLAEAILVTIFCFLPFGIVAIVYASQVNSKIAEGNYRAAQIASSTAATWCWVSFGCGLGWALIVFVIFCGLGGAWRWM
jgi:hypothetical protein